MSSPIFSARRFLRKKFPRFIRALMRFVKNTASIRYFSDQVLTPINFPNIWGIAAMRRSEGVFFSRARQKEKGLRSLFFLGKFHEIPASLFFSWFFRVS